MPTNGATNGQVIQQPSGKGSTLPVVSSVAGIAGYPANGPIQGAVLPYWSYGTGVPTFTAPLGSMYTDINATAVGSNRLYIAIPSAVGNAVVQTWKVVA